MRFGLKHLLVMVAIVAAALSFWVYRQHQVVFVVTESNFYQQPNGTIDGSITVVFSNPKQITNQKWIYLFSQAAPENSKLLDLADSNSNRKVVRLGYYENDELLKKQIAQSLGIAPFVDDVIQEFGMRHIRKFMNTSKNDSP